MVFSIHLARLTTLCYFLHLSEPECPSSSSFLYFFLMVANLGRCGVLFLFFNPCNCCQCAVMMTSHLSGLCLMTHTNSQPVELCSRATQGFQLPGSAAASPCSCLAVLRQSGKLQCSTVRNFPFQPHWDHSGQHSRSLWPCLLPPSASECEREHLDKLQFLWAAQSVTSSSGPGGDFRYVILTTGALRLENPSRVLVTDLTSRWSHVPQTFPQMPTSGSWYLSPYPPPKSYLYSWTMSIASPLLPWCGHAFLVFLCNFSRIPSSMSPSTPWTFSFISLTFPYLHFSYLGFF